MDFTETSDDYTEMNEETLRNENPGFVPNFFGQIGNFLGNYGWYILFISIAFAFIYNKYIRPHVESYLKKRSDAEYDAKYHKNPDLYQARLLAQEQSRRKMQQLHDKMAEEYKIKMEEKEQKKREEKVNRHSGSDSNVGTRLGGSKPEYNPLMGSGSGSSYRAPKRSPCSGGGCGK